MKKKYLEMWHKAQTASNLDKKSIADIAIFNTFNSMNAEYRSSFEEDDLENMPSMFSKLKNDSGVLLTEDCTFTSASSPLIALSPMTYVGIGCQVRGVVGCDMGKCLQAAAPKGFEVKNIVKGKTWVQKRFPFWNKLIEVKVNFFGLRGKDRSHKPAERAKLMQELSEKLSDKGKKAVQLLMTVVTFARTSHVVVHADTPDVALITLGYCLVKQFGAGWDKMVEMMRKYQFTVELLGNFECNVQVERYKKKNGNPNSTVDINIQTGMLYIESHYLNLIMEQYDDLVKCNFQP
eukprot:GHVS01014032.1.p1 GENE.GHVS01014032.1~~GHVS01014032.1.p1  ORF type:complete len:292 (+),score=13.02 GHVS01014032.1:382-1257(+)